MVILRFLLCILISVSAVAGSNQVLTYQGVLTNSNDEPYTTPQTVEFLIYSPSPGSCLLYSETQTVTPDSRGRFVSQIGTGTRTDPGSHSFNSVFVNGGTLPSLTCASGTSYTPTSTDDRLLSIKVNGVVLSPSMAVKAVPFAMQAHEIDGWGINNLVKVSSIGSPTTFTTGEMERVKTISAAACAPNEILKWNGSAWLCSTDASGSGGISTESDPTVPAWAKNPLSTRLAVKSGSLDLATVSAGGTFGSATQVPVLTIDAYGRVTSVANTAITGVSPIGSSLTSGQIWIGNTSNLATAVNLSGDASLSSTGALTVHQLKGKPVDNANLGPGALLVYNNTFGKWEATVLPSCTSSESLSFNSATGTFSCSSILSATNFSGNLSGDVAGPQGTTTVRSILSTPLAFSGLSGNDLLRYNGSAWVNTTIPVCGSNQYLSYNGTYFCANDSGASGSVSSLAANLPLSVNASTGAVTISLGYDNTSIGLNGSNQLSIKPNSIGASMLTGGNSGDLFYKTASSWATGTPNAAGLADLATAQTITGGKTFTGSLIHNSTEATRIAAGTPAQRPVSGSLGMIRLNSSTNRPEYYDGTSWVSVGVGDGTVTSVGLTVPSFLAASSAVTTSGNITLSLQNQTAKAVFAGPVTGSGVPSFRALEASDIPSLDASKIGSGVLPVAFGGTGSTTTLTNGKVMVSSAGKIIEGAEHTPLNSASTFITRDSSGNFESATAKLQSLKLANASASVELSIPAATTSYGLLLPPTAGTSGQYLKNNGSGQLVWDSPSGSGTVTSVQAGTGLLVGSTAGASITGSGVLNVDVGSTANKIVQLDSSARLPAVDGSQLSNLSTGQLANGVLPVNRGGTGVSALTGNRLVVTNSTGTGLDPQACAMGEVISFQASGNFQCVDGQTLTLGFRNGGNNFGTTALLGSSDFQSLHLQTNGIARMFVDTSGQVGIGVTAATGVKLQVDGPIVGKSSATNSTTINFANGNLASTTASCASVALHNMRDGATYTLAINNTTSTLCGFTAFSDTGSTSLTVLMPPDHGTTIAGKRTLYTFMVIGPDVFVSWVPGY